MKAVPRWQSGISLIEALVALAVMAFGMLALVGMQGTLRGSSDISKQRSEAVRFAQQMMENKRGFSVLDDPLDVRRSFTAIANEGPDNVEVENYTSSATFSRGMTVTGVPALPFAVTASETDLYYTAPRKQVRVLVTWKDRNDELQSAELNTIISRTAPEVVGALSVSSASSVVRQPGHRNVNIPPGAVDITDETGRPTGKSRFKPPGSGEYWRFLNSTGLIDKVCYDAAFTNCKIFRGGYLLAGYVRYAVNGRPTSTESETPPDYSLPVADSTVSVVVHTPGYSDSTLAEPTLCYVDTATDQFGAYFCAVEVGLDGTWSGRSTVTINRCWSRTVRHDAFYPIEELTNPYRCVASDAELFADSIDDASTYRFRICRYTSRPSANAAVGSGTPPMRNFEHPKDYVGVSESLSNQNFLVIRAGDNTLPYDCPQDDSSTPLVGTTYHHQPPAPVN